MYSEWWFKIFLVCIEEYKNDNCPHMMREREKEKEQLKIQHIEPQKSDKVTEIKQVGACC